MASINQITIGNVTYDINTKNGKTGTPSATTDVAAYNHTHNVGATGTASVTVVSAIPTATGNKELGAVTGSYSGGVLTLQAINLSHTHSIGAATTTGVAAHNHTHTASATGTASVAVASSSHTHGVS